MNGFVRARERIAVREVDPVAAKNLAQALNIPFAAASIMVGRGLADTAACSTFFNPTLADFHDPFLFDDMEKAVNRIVAALSGNEAIAVFGDYDVDGISGTTLLVRALRSLGGRVDYYLPHRLTEGYGVSEAGIKQVAASGATRTARATAKKAAAKKKAVKKKAATKKAAGKTAKKATAATSRSRPRK